MKTPDEFERDLNEIADWWIGEVCKIDGWFKVRVAKAMASARNVPVEVKAEALKKFYSRMSAAAAAMIPDEKGGADESAASSGRKT